MTTLLNSLIELRTCSKQPFSQTDLYGGIQTRKVRDGTIMSISTIGQKKEKKKLFEQTMIRGKQADKWLDN
jgi:hypothetical protein